jgi:hypothetical protein
MSQAEIEIATENVIIGSWKFVISKTLNYASNPVY